MQCCSTNNRRVFKLLKTIERDNKPQTPKPAIEPRTGIFNELPTNLDIANDIW